MAGAAPFTPAATDDDRAAEALRLATVSPDRARDLAEQAERYAVEHGDWATASVAARAWGVAAMQLRDLDGAIPRLQSSVRAARRAAAPRLAGEARMSLASALALRGVPTRAIHEINTALRDLDGVPQARARVQRAAVLQELGRLDEALDDVRQALPALRRAGDVQWQVRALSNRGLMHSTKRSFAAAEADLVAAARLCAEHELELPAAYVEQNLGCLHASRGDVPAALAHFDAAAERYRRLGMQVGSLLVDRAQLLLSVRLVDEARANAEAAVQAYEAQKRHLHVPEALLLLSTVALVQGDVDVAVVAAEQAAHAFARLGRREWLSLARFARLQALAWNGRSVAPGEARRTAEQLATAGWTIPSLEARLLAGRLALQAGRREQAREDLALASRARFDGPADGRARAWLAEALLRRADGRRPAARRAIAAGLRVVEELRATLGATELRAHVSVHRGALAALGLRMALEDGSPRQVLAWAERGRVTGALRPVRPPDDPVLAAHLADLRETMTEIEHARGEGRQAAALVQRQVTLEHEIRDRLRLLPGNPQVAPPAPFSLAEVARALGPAALVEYVEVDEELSAVTLTDGRLRLHRLGPARPVHAALAHVPFALARLADPRSRPGSLTAAAAVLDRAAATFDQVLLRPLARDVADRPLVLVPTATLQSLPWPLLPSCAARQLTVAPSATSWRDAAQRRPRGGDGATVVVAGPGLPGARREAASVASLYRSPLLLVEADATTAAVSRALAGARLAHVAAHGELRTDNPLFSHFRLADGPFTVYDLERVEPAPHTVVLAACDTGRSHVVGGVEPLGVTAALLACGTATLVAPVVRVPDAETETLMTALHRGLAAGSAPAEALARAQQELCQGPPPTRAAALSFTCFGAGLPAAAAIPPPRAAVDADVRADVSVDVRADLRGGVGPELVVRH